MLKVVHEENQSQQHVPAGVGGSLLDELARDGARQMLAAALLAEVAAYVEAHAGEVDEDAPRRPARRVDRHRPQRPRPSKPEIPCRRST